MRWILTLALTLVLSGFATPVRAAGEAVRPNIIFIYADDLGWGDISCHGAENWLKTPSIDRLAAEGIDFQQFNVLSPVCSPSRVAAMTGRFPSRYGINNVFNGSELGPKKSGTMPDWLDPKAPMLPRFLKGAGYHTVHLGKWHMGADRRLAPDAPDMDEYGIVESKVYHGPGPQIDRREIGFEAARVIERLKDKQPFFMNVWIQQTHTLHAPTQESMDLFKDLDLRRQVYAATLREADLNVERVLEALKAAGLEQNTIVVFSSDNGPAGRPVAPGDRAPEPADGDMVKGFDVFYSVGSSGGLRGRKAQLYEGGVRTPFIVRWPGHAPAGLKNDQTVFTAVDLLPTLCAAAGVELPADYQGDGENLLAAFNGKPVLRRKPIFWKYYAIGREADQWPAWAMREGVWKLLIDLTGERVALHDLKKDRAEQADVSKDHPDVVARMKPQLLDWTKSLPTSADPACLARSAAPFVLPAMAGTSLGQETLPPLKDGKAPATFEEMWAGFDPRKEPLDVEVLKEWEEDGVVLKVLRYRIGIFKGQKAMMAAVYGHPKGGMHLPGLVQIHGGGQYANYQAPLGNAKRGYATLSIAWAGRLTAPGYEVTPDVVQLFWAGRTNDPKYRLTTDWGALDGYHAPSRDPKTAFPSAWATEWTLDAVESPRNSPWFLCALGARRALTFLEQQPEVDKGRLGVYGHSMGGKLTVMVAASDPRVKAAAPSCGGISDRDNQSALFRATVGDDAQLPHVACPIFFLSPANDFHGRINDLPAAVREIQSRDWRITSAAHHNHQDTAEYEVATQLWFDHWLKGTFAVPRTPDTTLELKTAGGVPVMTVRPDASRPILAVDVYYTQQGQMDGKPDDRENTIARFWHHVSAAENGQAWIAELPVFSVDAPLWAYANVLYKLDAPVSGAGYYYRPYATSCFNVSSRVRLTPAADLQAAGVRATLKPSLEIESFAGEWRKEWFTYRPEEWARSTHKIYDPQWRAPAGVLLALEVRSEQPNRLVVGLDRFAAEVSLVGGAAWQTVALKPSDFRDAEGVVPAAWAGLKELRLGTRETMRSKKEGEKPTVLGSNWQGAEPVFRNLRWTGGEAGNPGK